MFWEFNGDYEHELIDVAFKTLLKNSRKVDLGRINSFDQKIITGNNIKRECKEENHLFHTRNRLGKPKLSSETEIMKTHWVGAMGP